MERETVCAVVRFVAVFVVAQVDGWFIVVAHVPEVAHVVTKTILVVWIYHQCGLEHEMIRDRYVELVEMGYGLVVRTLCDDVCGDCLGGGRGGGRGGDSCDGGVIGGRGGRGDIGGGDGAGER